MEPLMWCRPLVKFRNPGLFVANEKIEINNLFMQGKQGTFNLKYFILIQDI